MSDLYTFNPTQIVVYTTEHCSDCSRVKAFFEANNISYLPVRLEGNSEATDFIMKINKGYQSVPTIIFPNGSVLVEPDWRELKSAIHTSSKTE